MAIQDDWVKVYSTSQEHEAQILKDVLESSEIPCTLLNKKDSAYGFGYVELYTIRDYVVRAKHLIEKSIA